MESTSGTADLGALRGATGDAAPWALMVGLREQANHRTVPDVVGVARASECALKSSGLPVPPVNNGQGAAGGQRELVVRGLADLGLVGRLRSAGRGFARWGRVVAIQPRLARDRWCRALQPISPRLRDRRCTSGSSLGIALSSVRMPAEHTRHLRVSSRERRCAGLPDGPWFVRARLASGESLRSGREARAQVEAVMPPG